MAGQLHLKMHTRFCVEIMALSVSMLALTLHTTSAWGAGRGLKELCHLMSLFAAEAAALDQWLSPSGTGLGPAATVSPSTTSESEWAELVGLLQLQLLLSPHGLDHRHLLGLLLLVPGLKLQPVGDIDIIS